MRHAKPIAQELGRAGAVAIGEKAAAAIALIMHEQATNAVKYGALLMSSGHITICPRCEGDTLHLLW
ncbi:hypothetical protein VQ02_06110 [Methylobacterium variabile]|uniref:Uncharacterized protein n=2 Tax=Methylobacterium variabile TaxID=298794 RepID=A0A0J6VPU8_9HYPH|nr:hypothetical protein VQ02_06110 [Methylobacterium variabile]